MVKKLLMYWKSLISITLFLCLWSGSTTYSMKRDNRRDNNYDDRRKDTRDYHHNNQRNYEGNRRDDRHYERSDRNDNRDPYQQKRPLNQIPGNTDLHNAVLNNDLDMVKKILKSKDKEALINKQKKGGQTALHIACGIQHYEIFQQLLDHGANIALLDKDKKNILHQVLLVHDNEIRDKMVNALITYFSKINSDLTQVVNQQTLHPETSKKDVTPLHLSISRGYVELTKIMLAHKADISLVDLSNSNLFHRTFLLSDQKTKDLMLETLNNYIDLNNINLSAIVNQQKLNKTTNVSDATPLHLAIAQGYLTWVKKFLNNGADLSLVNAEHQNVLHLIIMIKDKNKREEVLSLIINVIKNNKKLYHLMQSKNNRGQTPLELAYALTRPKEIIDMLKACAEEIDEKLEVFRDQIPCYKQPEDWESAYRAVFNLIQIKSIPPYRYTKTTFDTEEIEQKYQHWLRKLKALWEMGVESSETFMQGLFEKKEALDKKQVYLLWNLAQKLELTHNDKIQVNDLARAPENVSIIEHGWIYGSKQEETLDALLNNISSYRENEKPQIIILINNKHCIGIYLTKNDLAIVDSCNGKNKALQVITDIFNLFKTVDLDWLVPEHGPFFVQQKNTTSLDFLESPENVHNHNQIPFEGGYEEEEETQNVEEENRLKELRYTCTECQRQCEKREFLFNHLKLEHNKFLCPFDDSACTTRVYNEEKLLREHIDECHKNQACPIEGCGFCNRQKPPKKINKKDDKQEQNNEKKRKKRDKNQEEERPKKRTMQSNHIMNQHIGIFKCGECNWVSYKQPTAWAAHIKNVHPELCFMCKKCSKFYLSEKSLEKHTQKCGEKTVINRPIEYKKVKPKTYERMPLPSAFWATKIADDKHAISCPAPGCDKKIYIELDTTSENKGEEKANFIKALSKIIHHVTDEHALTFDQSNNLLIFQANITDKGSEALVFCPLCEKTFTTKSALTEHMEEHDGPYPCHYEGCNAILKEDRMSRGDGSNADIIQSSLRGHCSFFHKHNNKKLHEHLNSTTEINEEKDNDDLEYKIINDDTIDINEILDELEEPIEGEKIEFVPKIEIIEVEKEKKKSEKSIIKKASKNNAKLHCNLCENATFNTNFHLAQHMLLVHESDIPCPYDQCTVRPHEIQLYSDSGEFEEHIRDNHSTCDNDLKSIIACPFSLCGQSFDLDDDKRSFITHMYDHSPFACSICNYTYGDKKELKVHNKLTHSKKN